MNLRKVITRLSSAPEDPQELRRVARALGHELPHERLSRLRDFRAEIGRVESHTRQQGRAPEYASGYLTCMLDVTAEYEVALSEREHEQECRQAAQREGWCDVLSLLRDGPMLPSAMAGRLGVDRSNITRLLHRMRAAGVVEVAPGDPLDGRTRPHRMTLAGRRLLDELQQSLPADVKRGIQVAVSLIHYMTSHDAGAAHELAAVALAELGDPDAAAQAVEAWTEAFADHGLLRDIRPGAADSREHAGAATEPPRVKSSAPWQRAPLVLARVQRPQDPEPVPLYVRTSDDAWPAWAYALTQEHGHGRSRAIVDGDIRARSIQAPDQPFRLVYDDPSAISADRQDPTMRELMARADEKFVVAYSDTELEDVPNDFVAIALGDSLPA